MHMKLIVLLAVLGIATSDSSFTWLKTKYNLREIKESDINLNDFPASLDWRTKDVISPVKNQGQMGNPVAVAAVEVIESLNAIKAGKLVTGSIARVADCCPQPNDPFQCITKLGGLCSEAEYPTPTGKCIPNQCEPVLKFDTVRHLKNKNESTMVAWIQDSPLFAGLDASRPSFQEYIGGIYSDASCSKQAIDHALQIVGYGEAQGTPYWICKNSWGTSWGEQGYIRILRGSDTCGIAVYVSQVA